MAGSQDDIPPPPPPPSQTPTQQTPHNVSTIKLPILKKGEYDIWAMKMEYYLTHTDYPIWEVIQTGNGPVSITTDTQEDHLAKFHKMTDAKEMWNAIKSRFGRNDESKKMQKFQSLLSQLEIHGAGVYTEDTNQKFLRSLPSSRSQVSLIMRTKPGVDSLSFDDLYNNLRVFENDVKGSTASSSSTQNVAFVSENTSSTNDVSTAYGVSNPSDHEDLEQLDEFDLEEIDLKWQVAIISMRMKKFYKKTGRKIQFDARNQWFDKTPKVECYNFHKTCHFARECKTKRYQDSRRRDAWNSGNKDGEDGSAQAQTQRMKRNYSQREIRPIWNNVKRVNHQNQFVHTAVLTRTGKIPVNTARASGTKNVSTARHSFNRHAVLTSAAMKVNTVKPIVNRVRPTTVFHKTHSPFSKPFNKTTSLRTKFSKQKVNTAKVNAVSAVGKKRETAVKPSTGCNWRPQKHHYWQNDYPHRALQNKGIVDSGCSRHMTGNKAYLAEYQDFNGGPPCLLLEVIKEQGFYDFKVKGIKMRYSNARTPQQNGVAERKNMTLIEAARTMLADSFLPNTFWAEAVSTACYVLNRVLVTKPHNKTPYELITGKGPTWLFDLDYLTDSMNYQPVRSENQANKHAGPQEANQNAGTEDIIDAGDSEKEDESAQDYFVLPIWSSYSSTVKRSIAKDAGDAPNKHPDLKGQWKSQYGYIKNHKKTIKNGQAQTRERKSAQKPEAKPKKSQTLSQTVKGKSNNGQLQKTKPKNNLL
ncbi:ribonuclease H-like domain-containing protein [Tanacetum coccineum]